MANLFVRSKEAERQIKGIGDELAHITGAKVDAKTGEIL